MRHTRRDRLRLLGVVVSCVTALSLYATATTSDVGSFSHSQTGANVLDPATIDAIGDKVADWQLANLDDLSYIRERICATRTRIAVAGNTARCMWA